MKSTTINISSILILGLTMCLIFADARLAWKYQPCENISKGVPISAQSTNKEVNIGRTLQPANLSLSLRTVEGETPCFALQMMTDGGQLMNELPPQPVNITRSWSRAQAEETGSKYAYSLSSGNGSIILSCVKHKEVHIQMRTSNKNTSYPLLTELCSDSEAEDALKQMLNQITPYLPMVMIGFGLVELFYGIKVLNSFIFFTVFGASIVCMGVPSLSISD